MNMFRIKPSYWLLLIPVLKWNLPWLAYRVNAWFLAPFIIAWFFFMFLENRKPFVPRMVSVQLNKWFWMYLLMTLLYGLLPYFYGIGLNNPTWRLYQFTWKSYFSFFVHSVTILFIVHWSLSRGYVKELRFYGLVIVVCMILTGVAAVRGGSDVMNIGSGRLVMGVAVGRQVDAFQAETVFEEGMAGFSGIYYAAFVSPLLMLTAISTRKKWFAAVLLVAVAGTLLTIQNGGLATPLMTLGVGFGLLLVSTIMKRTKVVMILGIGLTVFFIVFSYKPTILSFIRVPLQATAEATRDYPWFYSRFKSLAEAVGGNLDTYAAVRYERQQMSFNAFIHGNWLTGNIRGGPPIGAHSELLDCMGAYGLVGFSILITLLISFNKYLYTWGLFTLGRKWLAMPAIYTASWLVTSITNPNQPALPDIFLLIVCLAVFFYEFEKRNTAF